MAAATPALLWLLVAVLTPRRVVKALGAVELPLQL